MGLRIVFGWAKNVPDDKELVQWRRAMLPILQGFREFPEAFKSLLCVGHFFSYFANEANQTRAGWMLHALRDVEGDRDMPQDGYELWGLLTGECEPEQAEEGWSTMGIDPSGLNFQDTLTIVLGVAVQRDQVLREVLH